MRATDYIDIWPPRDDEQPRYYSDYWLARNRPNEDDARRIKRALAGDPTCTVEMSCFNEADMRGIEARLTPDECARVRFKWLVWP